MNSRPPFAFARSTVLHAPPSLTWIFPDDATHTLPSRPTTTPSMRSSPAPIVDFSSFVQPLPSQCDTPPNPAAQMSSSLITKKSSMLPVSLKPAFVTSLKPAAPRSGSL